MKPATMELPPPLRSLAPASLDGIGYLREGRFAFESTRVEFKRSARQVTVLGVGTVDSDKVRVRWQPVGGEGREWSCTAHGLGLTRFSVKAPVAPRQQRCAGPNGATLELAEVASGPLAPVSQQGQLRDGDVVLTLRSQHRVQGVSTRLEGPTGYVMSVGDRPVAALETVGDVPRLWRAEEPAAVRQAVTDAALMLALTWNASVP